MSKRWDEIKNDLFKLANEQNTENLHARTEAWACYIEKLKKESEDKEKAYFEEYGLRKEFKDDCHAWEQRYLELNNQSAVLELALSRLYDLLNENRDNRYCSNCEFADVLFGRCKNEGLYTDCKGNILNYVKKQTEDELKSRQN